MRVRDRKRRLSLLAFKRFRGPGFWRSNEEMEWVNMPPIGREFGSPDYDKLMRQDDSDRRANLVALVTRCTADSVASLEIFDADEMVDVGNVRSALHALGHDVSLEVAATIWLDHSKSLMARWMVGAETVIGAKNTLLINCTKKPGVGADTNLTQTADFR